MDQFWVIFWGVIGTVATGLATWLTTVIVSWLNSKIKDAKVAKWATAVTEIIFSAVQTVMQEFVSVMKDNGSFDKKAQMEAKEKAYAIISGQLTTELKNYITENFGDMREWILNQIEATIYQLKA